MNTLFHRASTVSLTYHHFQVAKRNGTMRDVREPNPALKAIQREILDTVLAYLPTLPHAYGFVKGRSIIDNARLHLNKQYVVNMDLAEFFHSITETRVRHVFQCANVNDRDSRILAQTCTVKISPLVQRRLSQGAPTSPFLANHAARHLDVRLQGLCKKAGYTYSRYADDLTLSGNEHPANVIREAKRIIVDEGFQVNPSKTRTAHASRAQLVTGIRVDKGRLRPSQELLGAYATLMRDPSRTRAQVTGYQQMIDMVYRLNKGITVP